VFSTWLAKRVGGMVGEKNEVNRSVGGGTVLCNLLKQVAEVGGGYCMFVELNVFTLTASSHEIGSCRN
jgi:hypothetical protein